MRILDYVGGVLVIPQTVLVEHYWQEIRAGFDKAAAPVRHVLLHAERDVIAGRIDADTIDVGAHNWRHNLLDVYEAAREAEVFDTADLSDAARAVVARVGLTATS